MEEDKSKKEPIKLDWDKLLEVSDDQPLPSLVIVKSKKLDEDDHMESPFLMERMTDSELETKIERIKDMISKLPGTLSDNGVKIRSYLKRLEDHRDYRNSHRKPEIIQLEKSKEFEKPVVSLKSDGLRRETLTRARDCDRSTFADIFMERINGDNEISLLNPCDRNGKRGDNESGLKRKPGNQSRARQSPPKHHHRDFSCERGIKALSNDRAKGSRASPACFDDIRGNSSNLFYDKRKDSWHGSNSSKARLRKVHNSNEARPRKEKAIVLLDDEESKCAETLELPGKPDES